MGNKWVQLRQLKNIERNGKIRQYHPGDWVSVGKSTALRWIADGSAYDPSLSVKEYAGEDFGVRILWHIETGHKVLDDEKNEIPTATSGPLLPWDRTLVWNPDAVMRKELLAVGFHFLDTWQMACPMIDYEIMAKDRGSEEDKKKTEALIGDLRVPLYDPSLIFVRKCAETIQIFRDWQEEDNDLLSHHALLRAIYRTKPFILALPPNWTDPNYRSSADDW